MTENENSPENLRKFLESDDPALVLRLIGSRVKRWEERIVDYDAPNEIDYDDPAWYLWNDCLKLISEISKIETLEKLIEICICYSGGKREFIGIIEKSISFPGPSVVNEELGRHYINWLRPKVASPFPCSIPYKVFETATEALQEITNKKDVWSDILKSREEEFQKYFLPIRKRKAKLERKEKKRTEMAMNQSYEFLKKSTNDALQVLGNNIDSDAKEKIEVAKKELEKQLKSDVIKIEILKVLDQYASTTLSFLDNLLLKQWKEDKIKSVKSAEDNQNIARITEIVETVNTQAEAFIAYIFHPETFTLYTIQSDHDNPFPKLYAAKSFWTRNMHYTEATKIKEKKIKDDDNTRVAMLRKFPILFSNKAVLNLEMKNFTKIINDRNGILEVLNYYSSTSKGLVDLLSSSSSQTRWIVACGIIELSYLFENYRDRFSIKMGADFFNIPAPNIFWCQISNYQHPITRNDRDEIVKVLKSLPPVLAAHIGKSICNFAIKAFEQKEVSDVMKKNRKMITTIFEDPTLAKYILGPLSR